MANDPRRKSRVLEVALLQIEAIVDLVPGRVVEAHRCKLRTERSDGCETRLNRLGGLIVLAGIWIAWISMQVHA